MVWTLVEPGVAITAASLVTIRPLLRVLKLRGFESTPADQDTPLTLRNDISGGHWSTIESQAKNGQNHKRKFSLTAMERLNGSGKLETRKTSEEDTGGEEGSEGGFPDEGGITRTVDYKVVHVRASQLDH